MINEKIISIQEKTFKVEAQYGDYDGFEIVTNQQTIKIGISNGQSCCESFGCIITNDDIADFVGAKIKGLSLTDKVLNNKKIDDLEYLGSGGAMFVNLETNKGLLQFVAYNSHNQQTTL